ncbi:MAG: HTH domain-containing protein [Oscillibacter sp.]|jgi:DeoR/GlpR family transcriptional regulator of sugar metabolism|nr:HTH domain-containing protein [Oscillibacter sp.]
MSASERRQRILEILCLRRQDTYSNLASEFNVSRETIRNDITLLMCSYPIETVRGRYGGGVRLKADYRPYRKALNKKQVKLLVRLSAQLAGDDLATISSIIFQLAP